MIPVRLQLKNFLSYGPHTQTVDFTNHHLICLSGKNGHGKSALLDAIMWAIWGHARKTTGATKADEGLLRLGQTHMVVTCEFICNAIQYRVRREYVRSGSRGEARLYLGMYDSHNQRFRSLTENTTKSTQRVIHSIIGLDYESFINSVCIRQGQANAFSRKSPKERKEILANILGLDRFERYKKYAHEYMRSCDTSIEQLKSTCDQLYNDISHKDDILRQYHDCDTQLQTYQQQEQHLVQQDQQYQASEHTCIQQQQHLQHLYDRRTQTAQSYTQQKQQLSDLVAAWRATFREQRKMQSCDVKHAYEQQKAHVDTLEQYNTQYQHAREQYHQAERAAHERKQTLYTHFLQQQHDVRRTCAQYTTQLNHISEKLKQCHNNLSTYETQYNHAKQQLHELHDNETHHDTTIDDIDHELEQALHQSGRLVGSKRIINAQAAHTPHQRHTRQNARINRALSRAHARIKDLRNRRHNAREHIVQHHKHRSQIHHQMQKAHHYIQLVLSTYKEYIDLQHAYEQAHAQHHTWHQYEQNHFSTQAWDTYLNADPSYTRALHDAQQWSKQMHAAYIDPSTYEQAYARLKELQDAREQQHAAHTYQHVQDERRKHIQSVIHTLKHLKREYHSLTQQISQFPHVQEEHARIQAERRSLAQKLEDTRRDKDRTMQHKGALSQQLSGIQQKEQTYQEHHKQLQTYQNKREEYAQIAHAFSRDGIQALRIEHAIPEIEQEANALLSQLTDNQSQLYIESLRDLKSGKTKETLDIKISDSMGIRPYELFSGGEAFRIDFALRVAISKLLARRAGTQLQTLIIDEGFGSQDEDGLHHIMDALYKIQEHFSKIIIVSHLPSLKGHFPAHFVIHKGPHGSQVHIQEQG